MLLEDGKRLLPEEAYRPQKNGNEIDLFETANRLLEISTV